MPAETITLTQDQAEDLRELLSYAEIPEDWLLHAPREILASWHASPITSTSTPTVPPGGSSKTSDTSAAGPARPFPAINKSKTGQRLPPASRPAQRPKQDQRPLHATSCDGLDTATSIGNQNSPQAL